MSDKPRKTRELTKRTYLIKPLAVAADFEREPLAWLSKQAKALPVKWLLAHTEDGVIWGQWSGERFVLSTEAFPQPTAPRVDKYLRQVRIFGPEVEVFAWQTGEGDWRARVIDDRGTAVEGWSFDEPQVQWGDQAEAEQAGFTLLADGVQGLRQAVPLSGLAFKDGHRPVRLGVRQYVTTDADGLLVITQGRLYGLWAE